MISPSNITGEAIVITQYSHSDVKSGCRATRSIVNTNGATIAIKTTDVSTPKVR